MAILTQRSVISVPKSFSDNSMSMNYAEELIKFILSEARKQNENKYTLSTRECTFDVTANMEESNTSARHTLSIMTGEMLALSLRGTWS